MSTSEPIVHVRRRSRRRHHRREEKRLKKRAVTGLVGFGLVLAVALVFVARQSAKTEAVQSTPVYGYDVVAVYPHDANAFTEGLLYRDGYLYESTGLEGESTVRQLDIESGKVLRHHDVPRPHFGEGLTDWGQKLVQLTYTSKIAFVYDVDTFKELSKFEFTGQGWGLTHDDKRLIMSDGSANLRFFDPDTHRETGQIEVRDNGEPVTSLNELEFIRGDVYANVWHTNRLAVIDPASGRVREWIDLTGLNPDSIKKSEAVLNGIAYDANRDRLFVTGKWWEHLYEIRVRRGATAP